MVIIIMVFVIIITISTIVRCREPVRKLSVCSLLLSLQLRALIENGPMRPSHPWLLVSFPQRLRSLWSSYLEVFFVVSPNRFCSTARLGEVAQTVKKAQVQRAQCNHSYIAPSFEIE